MKRLLLLSSILLLSAVWAVAQYDAPSQDDTNKTTIQGCLAGSDGNFTLTDKSGTTYQLTGATAKLQAHVGHTISVTGTTGPSAGAPGMQSGSMSAPAETQPTLNVTSFKHVSPNCSSTR
jgi:hypothetical protein